MILLSELLKGFVSASGQGLEKPSSEQLARLLDLKKRLNYIRRKWEKPMIITSGLRSEAQQRALYEKLGKKPPMGSAHLSGEAADIYDRDGRLAAYLLENLGMLERLGLYMEEPSVTRGWVHLQTRRPGSGRRVFLP